MMTEPTQPELTQPPASQADTSAPSPPPVRPIYIFTRPPGSPPSSWKPRSELKRIAREARIAAAGIPHTARPGELWQKVLARRRDRNHPSYGYRRLYDTVRVTYISPKRIKGIWQSDGAVCLADHALWAASFAPYTRPDPLPSYPCPGCAYPIPSDYLAKLRMRLLRSPSDESQPCPGCSAPVLDPEAVLRLGAGIAAQLSWSSEARLTRKRSTKRTGRPAQRADCVVCGAAVPSARAMWRHTLGGRTDRCKGVGDAENLGAGSGGGDYPTGSKCLLVWDVADQTVWPRHLPKWLRYYLSNRRRGMALAVLAAAMPSALAPVPA